MTVPRRPIACVAVAIAGACSVGAAPPAREAMPAAAPSQPPAAPPPPPAAPPPPPVVERAPLDLTVRVRAERDGQMWGVRPGDRLKTGDFLELFVHLNQAAYVYVLQLRPDGTPARLFPDHGDRLLPGGIEHRIPASPTQSLQVDAHDREENIYVLVSRVPVAPSGPLISALERPRAPARVDAAAPTKPRRPDVVFSIQTRHIIVVDRPDRAPSMIEARDAQPGTTLVVRLSFKHT